MSRTIRGFWFKIRHSEAFSSQMALTASRRRSSATTVNVYQPGCVFKSSVLRWCRLKIHSCNPLTCSRADCGTHLRPGDPPQPHRAAADPGQQHRQQANGDGEHRQSLHVAAWTDREPEQRRRVERTDRWTSSNRAPGRRSGRFSSCCLTLLPCLQAPTVSRDQRLRSFWSRVERRSREEQLERKRRGWGARLKFGQLRQNSDFTFKSLMAQSQDTEIYSLSLLQ